MSVSVTELFVEQDVQVHQRVVHGRVAGPVVGPVAGPVQPEAQDAPWYDGLSFSGPLDPAGSLFAFLLALAATVGLVVMVAAVVRMVSAG